MRVITCNTNGIRSAIKKGFFTWLKKQQADVICIQETKAQLKELPQTLEGYYCYHSDAIKPGYSGVAIYTKKEPQQIHYQLGFECADNEGRYVQVDFAHVSIVSLYLPSGSSGEQRQALKYDFMKHYTPMLKKIIQDKKSVIICGDWNIAHKNIDIKNWRGNQKNSGFLPEERAWLDELFDRIGLVDAFRVINQEADQYTWWSNRGQAYAKNVGWRIDYQIVTPDLKNKIKHVSIYKDEKFSDHAPLIIDYDL